MFNRKANRIAELEARLEVARRPRQDAALADEGPASSRLLAELRKTKTDLRTTEDQLGEARQQVAQLIKRLGEYADRGIANGQAAARYRAAWRSARFRAAAYGEGILRHVEERDQWRDWLKQEQAATGAPRAALAVEQVSP